MLQRPDGRVAGRPPIRIGRYSGVWRARMIAVTLVGIVLVVLVSAANIGRGDFPISLVEVLAVLFGAGDDAQQFIVLELRLPRTLTGILVGAALGLSGAITQAIARNPLASPDILGVTAGASTAAVVVIVLGGSYGSISGIAAQVGLPIAALIGGLVTAGIVYALAYPPRGCSWSPIAAPHHQAVRGGPRDLGHAVAPGFTSGILPAGRPRAAHVPTAKTVARLALLK